MAPVNSIVRCTQHQAVEREVVNVFVSLPSALLRHTKMQRELFYKWLCVVEEQRTREIKREGEHNVSFSQNVTIPLTAALAAQCTFNPIHHHPVPPSNHPLCSVQSNLRQTCVVIPSNHHLEYFFLCVQSML